MLRSFHRNVCILTDVYKTCDMALRYSVAAYTERHALKYIDADIEIDKNRHNFYRSLFGVCVKCKVAIETKTIKELVTSASVSRVRQHCSHTHPQAALLAHPVGEGRYLTRITNHLTRITSRDHLTRITSRDTVLLVLRVVTPSYSYY